MIRSVITGSVRNHYGKRLRVYSRYAPFGNKDLKIVHVPAVTENMKLLEYTKSV